MTNVVIGVSMIGQFVRASRRRRRLSQVELAARTGLSQNYISKLETGQIELPQRATLEALGAALDISLAEFYRAAGVLPEAQSPVPEEPPAQTRQDGIELALADVEAMSNEEAIAFVESLPGRYHHRMLARERELRTPESYARFCRGILGAWVSNRQAALDAAQSARE